MSDLELALQAQELDKMLTDLKEQVDELNDTIRKRLRSKPNKSKAKKEKRGTNGRRKI